MTRTAHLSGTCDTCGGKCDYRSIECRYCKEARTYDPAPWTKYAACTGMDPDLFFPDQHAGSTDIDAAKAVCATCVVRTSCLEYALNTPERWGVWGGLSAQERRKIRRARREAAA